METNKTLGTVDFHVALKMEGWGLPYRIIYASTSFTVQLRFPFHGCQNICKLRDVKISRLCIPPSTKHSRKRDSITSYFRDGSLSKWEIKIKLNEATRSNCSRQFLLIPQPVKLKLHVLVFLAYFPLFRRPASSQFAINMFTNRENVWNAFHQKTFNVLNPLIFRWFIASELKTLIKSTKEMVRLSCFRGNT